MIRMLQALWDKGFLYTSNLTISCILTSSTMNLTEHVHWFSYYCVPSNAPSKLTIHNGRSTIRQHTWHSDHPAQPSVPSPWRQTYPRVPSSNVLIRHHIIHHMSDPNGNLAPVSPYSRLLLSWALVALHEPSTHPVVLGTRGSRHCARDLSGYRIQRSGSWVL
jgi:hypothetical protein